MQRQRRLAQVVSLVVIGACASASPLHAQNCPELIGQLPGSAIYVAVSGNYAYLVGEDQQMVVADVSDPSTPLVVGQMVLPDPPEGIAIWGSHAYVAHADGLSVIDIGVPSAPVQVGYLDTPDYALDVAAADGYAYVAYGDPTLTEGGLRVIDVSTPSAPFEVGFAATPAPAFNLTVSRG